MKIFALLASIAPQLALAVTINITPGSQTVSQGTAASVQLAIAGLGDHTAPSVGVYDINISYDPTILVLNSVVFGDPVLGSQLDIFGLGDIQSFTPATGSVNLFELSLDADTDLDNLQAPAFVLAALMFNTIATGHSPLSIAINAVGDSDGNDIPVSTTAGSVDVQGGGGATTPEPGTVLTVLIGLMVVSIGQGCRINSSRHACMELSRVASRPRSLTVSARK